MLQFVEAAARVHSHSSSSSVDEAARDDEIQTNAELVIANLALAKQLDKLHIATGTAVEW